jgi:hypothetical protein
MVVSHADRQIRCPVNAHLAAAPSQLTQPQPQPYLMAVFLADAHVCEARSHTPIAWLSVCLDADSGPSEPSPVVMTRRDFCSKSRFVEPALPFPENADFFAWPACLYYCIQAGLRIAMVRGGLTAARLCIWVPFRGSHAA